MKEFIVHGDKSVLTDIAVSGENDADEIIFDFENLQQAQEGDNPIGDVDFESLMIGNLSDESESEGEEPEAKTESEEEEAAPVVAEPVEAEALVASEPKAVVKEKHHHRRIQEVQNLILKIYKG